MASLGRYERLIEPELGEFVRRLERLFPSDVADLPIEWQRQVYDRMCEVFHAGRPAGVVVADDQIDACGRTIPVRHYRVGEGPPGSIVYFHGGGFVFGGLDSHDDICAELCSETGLHTVSVDYRLAPEHRHPAAFSDAMAVFAQIAAQSEGPIVLCGESAGGTLTAAVAHATRGGPHCAIGQVLIYPALGGDEDTGSYVEHRTAPLLSLDDIVTYRMMRMGNAKDRGDPTFEPLRDTDFSDLPPTAIFTAQFDPLSTDGKVYAERICASGGRSYWLESPGLVHGYLRARRSVGGAQEAFRSIAAAVSALAEGRWPY